MILILCLIAAGAVAQDADGPVQPLIELPQATLDRARMWTTPGMMRWSGLPMGPVQIDLPDDDDQPPLYLPVDSSAEAWLEPDDADMDLGADRLYDDPVGAERARLGGGGHPRPPEDLDAVAFADDDAPGVPIEITVFGPVAENEARRAIVNEMERMGYRTVDRSGGRILFKPPETWMGRVRLEEDGTLTFGRPVVALRNVYVDSRMTEEEVTTPPGEVPNPNISRTPEGNVFYPGALEPGPDAADPNGGPQLTMPPIEAAFVVWPARNYLNAVRERVLTRLGPELERYRQIRQNGEMVARAADVRAALTSLWRAGDPLQGGAPLASYEARREAALGFWATRLDNPEGNLVSEVVEEWLQDVVMASDHPVTAEEEARAEDLRIDGRKLYLTRE